MDLNILFLDDMPERYQKFQQRMIGTPINLTWVQSVPEIQAVIDQDWDVIFLDHDLSAAHYESLEGAVGTENSGTALTTWILKRALEDEEFKKHGENIVWIVHSLNPIGANHMHHDLKNAGFKAWVRPFAWQDDRLSYEQLTRMKEHITS